MRIKEYYDVMIAKIWFWSCLWSVNLRLGTSYLVRRTKNFLLYLKWAPNLEISKNSGKFGLKCGTNDTLCHNFDLKMNFIRVWPWKKSSIVSHFVSHAQICVTQLLDQSSISDELMIVQYLIIAQYLMTIAQYLIFCF